MMSARSPVIAAMAGFSVYSAMRENGEGVAT